MDTLVGILVGLVAAAMLYLMGPGRARPSDRKDPAAEGRKEREKVLGTDPALVLDSLDADTRRAIDDIKRDAAWRILNRLRPDDLRPGAGADPDHPGGGWTGG